LVRKRAWRAEVRSERLRQLEGFVWPDLVVEREAGGNLLDQIRGGVDLTLAKPSCLSDWPKRSTTPLVFRV
jgi:hypothetical protein